MRGLLLLLLAAPLVELWFIIRVGSTLGAITTILLLVAAGMTGMALLRQQSLGTLLRVDQRLQQGELPASEIIEGFALALAGILLVIPGFITDFLALPLLVPPIRHWLARRFLRTGYYHQHYHYQQSEYRRENTDIIEGEWRREDDPRLR